MSKNSNERTCETGIYERSEYLIKQGKAYLLVGVLFVILELFLTFTLLSSDSFFDRGSMFYIIKDTTLFLYIGVLLSVSIPVFVVIVGVSSIHHGAKSRDTTYTDGERRLVSMVPVKGGIYLGEIESFCPKCDAEIGLLLANYCPKCGCELDHEEEMPE